MKPKFVSSSITWRTLNVVFFLRNAVNSPPSISSVSRCNVLFNSGHGEGRYPWYRRNYSISRHLECDTAARRNIPPKLNRKSRPILAVKYPVIIPNTLPDDNCWKSIGARERFSDKSACVYWWRGATPPTHLEGFQHDVTLTLCPDEEWVCEEMGSE